MHRNFCVKLFPDRNCGSIRMCDEIMDDTRYFSREYLKTHNGKMYGKYRGRYIDHEILENFQDDGANCMKKWLWFILKIFINSFRNYFIIKFF